MFLIDGTSEHDYLRRVSGRKNESPAGCADIGQWSDDTAQTTDFDSQTRAMRFVQQSRSKGFGEKLVARNIAGPRFCQSPGKRKQDRAARERDCRRGISHDITASIDDESCGGQKGFDLTEQQWPLAALNDLSRSGSPQHKGGAFDLCHQCGNPCLTRIPFRSHQRSASGLRTEAPHGESRNRKLVDGSQWRR